MLTSVVRDRKWLQDVFDVPLVVMLTDDEKALFRDNLTFEEVMEYMGEYKGYHCDGV